MCSWLPLEAHACQLTAGPVAGCLPLSLLLVPKKGIWMCISWNSLSSEFTSLWKGLYVSEWTPGPLPSLPRREVAECAQWSVRICVHRPRLDPRSSFLPWLVCPWLAGTWRFYPRSHLEIVLITLVQWTQWTAQSQDQCGVEVGHWWDLNLAPFSVTLPGYSHHVPDLKRVLSICSNHDFYSYYAV